ncbi:hypothetical protein ACQEU3_12630 [Spirillospora sp. CA-253888]
MTDDPDRAIDQVNQALSAAPPGASAVVRRVTLGCALNGDYRVIDEVGTARRDARSGVVVWEF